MNAFTLATMSGAEDEAEIHQLLPMIGTMNLAEQALEVYLTFVRSEAVGEIAKALEESPSTSSAAVRLSNIFNAAARLVSEDHYECPTSWCVPKWNINCLRIFKSAPITFKVSLYI